MPSLQKREKTVDAIRWAVVLLAMLTAWECARSINVAVRTKGLVTVEQFDQTASRTAGDFRKAPDLAASVAQFFQANADVIVACLFALGMVALVTRMLFASPLLDYLYLESPARDRRTMFGFLLTVGGILFQMGLLYTIVLFARPDGPNHSGMAPILMTIYLLGGAAWLLVLRLGSKREDKKALRGFLSAFGVNLVVGGALGAGVWYLSKQTNHDADLFHQNRLHNISVAAAAALLACTLDTFLQGRLYGKRGKGSALRNVLMLVVLLLLLAVGGYVVYTTGSFGEIAKAG